MKSLLQAAKEPFLNGGVNDMVVFLGDLAAMVTIAYYIKMDYLGFMVMSLTQKTVILQTLYQQLLNQLDF